MFGDLDVSSVERLIPSFVSTYASIREQGEIKYVRYTIKFEPNYYDEWPVTFKQQSCFFVWDFQCNNNNELVTDLIWVILYSLSTSMFLFVLYIVQSSVIIIKISILKTNIGKKYSQKSAP